jgi:hypothetical protein
VLDESGGDARAPAGCVDRQVVDVDLAARALELRQFVGDQAAHDGSILQCHERNDVLLRQDLLDVSITWRCVDVAFGVIKGLGEEDVQLTQQGNVMRLEAMNPQFGGHAVLPDWL